MPTIYLLRHGQANFGGDDYDVLSDLGARQARIAGAELDRRGLRAPVLYSGALRRQIDTAEIAGGQFACDLSMTVPEWNEVDAHALVDSRLGAPGASQGMTSAAFQEVLDEAMLEWMAKPGEGWHVFADAAFGALNTLASRLPRGSDAVVSTAAGVIAAQRIAARTGRGDILTGDMGGTSFDVAVVADGRTIETAQTTIDFGLVVRSPMIEMSTIGAGGGSIAWVEIGRAHV